MSSIVFESNISKGAKTLLNSLNVDYFIFDIQETIISGTKDVTCLIIVSLCRHIEFTEGMESVCYDDISEVAKRLEIMVYH